MALSFAPFQSANVFLICLFFVISAYNEEFNSLCTHQKRWFLNEVGQFSDHHVEIVFTKADDTVLDVFSALMILLGTGKFKWKLKCTRKMYNV